MKYYKVISTIILSVLCSIFVFMTANQYFIIQKIKNDYSTYYNEEADIRLRLHGKENSLYEENFPEIEDYRFHLLEVFNFYNSIMNHEKIRSMDVSYCLNVSDSLVLVGEGRFDILDLEITEGRIFTQKEIESGEKVIILNSHYSRNYHIGDLFEIKSSKDTNYSTEKAKIIGFYQNKLVVDDLKADKYGYMPNDAILEISNLWMSETTKQEYKNGFYPAGILNPIITCSSEKDSDEIIESIETKQHRATFKFDIVRIDSHHKSELLFKTGKYENKFMQFSLCAIATLFLIIIQEIVFYVFGLKNQNEFKEKMIYEQESNVQKIMSLNQETHRLKHDMKHFLNQLVYHVQRNENDRALQILNEYMNDFERLEIPAFTQNRIIDMVINYYLNKAKQENIDFTYSVTSVPSLNVNGRKLYILLSNALENAFLHGEKKKNIHLNISFIEPYYRFTVVNTISRDEKVDREGHGYGLISIKDIAKEMNGNVEFIINQDKYICSILLPGKTNEKE